MILSLHNTAGLASAESPEDCAEIMVGCTLISEGAADDFTFRIAPSSGWTYQNSSTSESGRPVMAEDMPLPDGTPAGQSFKDIKITGFSGNSDATLEESTGKIKFNKPGWYMYRIMQVIPDINPLGIKYDHSEYYVVVYVEYKDETSEDVIVKSVTAWHNPEGSGRHRPDLSDISSVTDNGGNAPSENSEPEVYGKTGIGERSVQVRFWNSIDTGAFSVRKNVTGNLGDLTKEFNFTADFSGLAPECEYAVENDGAEFISGANSNADGSNVTFLTDASGKAVLKFRLKDDDGFYFEGLPKGAVFSVIEEETDHLPSFTVTEGDSVVKHDEKHSSASLSTGDISVSKDKLYFCASERLHHDHQF